MTTPKHVSGTIKAITDALWPILGGNHLEAEMWQRIQDAISAAIQPDPEPEACHCAGKGCFECNPITHCPHCGQFRGYGHECAPDPEAKATSSSLERVATPSSAGTVSVEAAVKAVDDYLMVNTGLDVEHVVNIKAALRALAGRHDPE